MLKLFREIETEIGEIEVFVFNIGGNVRFDIRDTTARVYRKVWEMTAFAGFLTAREAAKAMVPRGRAPCCSPAPRRACAAAGLLGFRRRQACGRALAQSMARELGPQNIHVAHVVIDGAIDTEWIKANFPERYNAGRTRSSIPTISPRPTGSSTARSARPGPSRWISGRGRRPGRSDRNSDSRRSLSPNHRKGAP